MAASFTQLKKLHDFTPMQYSLNSDHLDRQRLADDRRGGGQGGPLDIDELPLSYESSLRHHRHESELDSGLSGLDSDDGNTQQ